MSEKLKNMLLSESPANEKGKRSLARLAAAEGISVKAVYKWLYGSTLPRNRAERIARRSKVLTMADFAPFLKQRKAGRVAKRQQAAEQ